MPALNIMAIHEVVRNSGGSSSRPSGILPKRLNASQSANTTNALADSTNAQPPAVITPDSTAEDTALSVSVDSAPQRMNAMTSTPAMTKIVRSMVLGSSAAVCSTGSPGSVVGWSGTPSGTRRSPWRHAGCRQCSSRSGSGLLDGALPPHECTRPSDVCPAVRMVSTTFRAAG